MNDADSTSPDGVAPQVPAHLLPDLLAAAKLGVEMACDGEWGEEVHLETVRAAVHQLDALEAGTCTRKQIAALAERAAMMQGDAVQSAAESESDRASFPVPIGEAWPKTPDAADMLADCAHVTRDLLKLRDEASG